jgi:hypothetical protein
LTDGDKVLIFENAGDELELYACPGYAIVSGKASLVFSNDYIVSGGFSSPQTFGNLVDA